MIHLQRPFCLVPSSLSTQNKSAVPPRPSPPRVALYRDGSKKMTIWNSLCAPAIAGRSNRVDRCYVRRICVHYSPRRRSSHDYFTMGTFPRSTIPRHAVDESESQIGCDRFAGRPVLSVSLSQVRSSRPTQSVLFSSDPRCGHGRPVRN